MASILAVLASILVLTASVWYNIYIFRGVIRPNLSSWLVWTFITLLSTSSYFVASGDFIKSLLPFSISAVTIITFGVILWKGRFARIIVTDITVAAIGIISGLVWFFTRSAAWGNLIVQFAVAVGGIPTYRSVLEDPHAERPGPWLLWSAGFILATVVVLMRWTGKPIELVYPILGVLLYGGIGVLALRRRNTPAPENHQSNSR